MTHDLYLRIRHRIKSTCSGLNDDELNNLTQDISEIVDDHLGRAIMEALDLGDMLNAVGLTITSKR